VRSQLVGIKVDLTFTAPPRSTGSQLLGIKVYRRVTVRYKSLLEVNFS